ncbi:MAG: cysteine synthase A [Leptospiraceae bacterium]|nr:cysteine synthase A [Leptospiraceae bacterium]MDW8306458.1 cysteine synthase A [Leptospiraceae bacterium]
MKVQNVLELIGATPHLRLERLFPAEFEVWIKLEKQNPGGSIKDRIALSMVEDAERRGLLKPGGVIVEPTSGNTGVGLAMVGAVKGYRVVLVMPESMSVERRQIMAAFGAEFVLTPREKGMRGAIEKAHELLQSIPNSWMPQQFENAANVEIHRQTTVQEILQDFPDGFDYIITGVGTGGHITAMAEILKQKWPSLQIWAVEPEASAVLSGGKPGPHAIQGIGAGFIPPILRKDLLDGVITVTKEDAYHYAQLCARKEGLLVGISTGAALAAVAKKIRELHPPKKILTVNYDTGERYLSLEGFVAQELER